MADHSISTSVRALLSDRIHSVEQLEALLLLRSEPGRAWNARAVAEALKLSPAIAEAALTELRQHELATTAPEEEDAFRYAPASPALARHVGELADSYRVARLELLVLISNNAMERLRTASLRTFARTFLVPKPQKDD